MVTGNSSTAKVISFPKTGLSLEKKYRKFGLNRNKEGSIRKVNGRVYVDFKYLDERVREPSGFLWNQKNPRTVREQLDRIIVAIKSGTFKFAEVFPHSKRADYFTEKERALSGDGRSPDEVLFKEYVQKWYDLLKGSGRVSERTLLGYKGYIDLYLSPFFDDMVFGSLNAGTFEKFIFWARKQRFRKKEVSNETINKCFVPLRAVLKSAAVEYRWGSTYNPFFGFKKLPESDPLEKIFPFSVEEQRRLMKKVPDHWKPYFRFAFCSGLRQGEQIGLKPGDIDWSKGLLHVRRAMTRDENGNRVEGRTKNRYSRRTIRLIPVMLESLKVQEKIYRSFKGEYFFCSTTGQQVNSSNLRQRVWIPALKKAGLKIREMRQTRHSFATVALSCGENPLWIAKVMGHRNTEMIIKVYSKYIENAGISNDGSALNDALQGDQGNEGEE
jgi:integrase